MSALMAASNGAVPDVNEVFVSLAGDAMAILADGSVQLVGGACRSCGTQTFPRTQICFACLSEDIEAAAMPRRGTLYSQSTVHVGPARWDKPYQVGYVDLPNGVRVFSHLAGNPAIGATVEVGRGIVGRDQSGALLQTFIFSPVVS